MQSTRYSCQFIIEFELLTDYQKYSKYQIL